MKSFYKYYFFLDKLDNSIEKKLPKLDNLNIIINLNEINIKDINDIVKFSKKNKLPFFIKNNFRLCIKFNANGIFIPAENKNFVKLPLIKKKLKIIGIAHNQKEYFCKINQKCEVIMLSPIFNNLKFSQNKILGLVKFNLISKDWKVNLGAIGGVMTSKILLNKIKLTKARDIGFKRIN